MAKSRIPVYRPDLSGNELKYVTECINSSWISSKGQFVSRFEEQFAKYCGLKYAASVSNGTVALHTALAALNIGPGDEVIVPTLTYIASVNAIKYTGAVPVFVDSLTDTWQMDPVDVKRKITPKTKVIMVVHLYGQPTDMDPIMKLANKNKIKVIEDCAEALGSKYKSKHVGQFGDIACFSFFGNKTITTGEGGMVATNSKQLIDKVRRIKGQGLAEGREYWHDILGYNYRMTNICAAIGLAQLERINYLMESKRKIANKYQQLFANSPITFHKEIGDVVHSFWMCSILVPASKFRDPLRKRLSDNGIETRPLFWPVHQMPVYATGEEFPVAQDLSSRGLNLPSWPGLSDGNIELIASLINSFVTAES